MKEYSLIEKIIIIVFDVTSFLTFCFFANLLKALLVGIFLFVIFSFVNSLIPEDKRIHADRLRDCFVLSIFYFLLWLLSMNLNILVMKQLLQEQYKNIVSMVINLN